MTGKLLETLTFEEFQKVEIRVGTIVEVKEFPEARRPAFKLWVDFGQEFGVRKTSAQITKNYDCLLYTSPSPRDQRGSRMPSSA